jgi:hypothetical protein
MTKRQPFSILSRAQANSVSVLLTLSSSQRNLRRSGERWDPSRCAGSAPFFFWQALSGIEQLKRALDVGVTTHFNVTEKAWYAR